MKKNFFVAVFLLIAYATRCLATTEIDDFNQYSCCVDIYANSLEESNALKSSASKEVLISGISTLDSALQNLKLEKTEAEDEPETETETATASYSEEDLELLAHIINAEEGIEYEDEQKTAMLQLYAGQVVLNRRDRHYMGAYTIEDVLYSPGQYACIHDHSWSNPVTDTAYENARLLLSGAEYWDIYDIPKMPDNVIYQAEFKQGDGVWKHVGDAYFCYED